VKNGDIAEQGYNLSVSTYVEQEGTREKVDIAVLNAEIERIVTRSDELRKSIDEIIVEILDNFTELTAELTQELTAELIARKKQYEHYRNTLLSFGDVAQNSSVESTGGAICTKSSGWLWVICVVLFVDE
jgi:predicted transcriptional regulator